MLGDQLADQFLGFAAGRSVANADESALMFVDQVGEPLKCAVPFVDRASYINDIRVPRSAAKRDSNRLPT